MKLSFCILLIYFYKGVISASLVNSQEFDALLARFAATENTIKSLKNELDTAKQQIQVN
jgi:hypothetical protein